MARYIDAGDLKRRFRWWLQGDNDLIQYALPSDIELFDRFVDSAPTADVEEVKHGYWIIKPHGFYLRMGAFCSSCGEHSGIGGIEKNQRRPYCPNCGAKMDGKENEDD